MKRFSQSFFSLLAVVFTLLLVINPSTAMESAEQALNLCVRIVIPSLFPFFICSRLLIDFGVAQFCSRFLSPWTRKLFGVPGSGATAIILGILSGYPIGAATAVELYEQGTCTKTEAERLLTFCNNAGPMFILGSVGIGMLHDRQFGVLLYLSHLFSALLTGILYRKLGETHTHTRTLPPSPSSTIKPASSFVSAITDAVDNILKVCGFVIFFSVFCGILPWRMPILHALLEMTGGLNALIAQLQNTSYLLPVVSFFLALSGISILLQTAGIVLPSGLSMKPVLFGKFTQAIISFLLTWLACKFLPLSHPAFAGLLSAPPLPTIPQLLSLVVLELVIVLLSTCLLCLVGMVYEKIEQRR